jgi:hypothetical protein
VSYLYSTDRAFNNYANGVFSGCTSKKDNHAVLVVGYGEENGEKYWLIRNSWGTTWGNGGFMKILRGNNECGIGMYCYTAQCEPTTGPLSDPPLSPPTPAPLPVQQECDMRVAFGRVTGQYKLDYYGKVTVYFLKLFFSN